MAGLLPLLALALIGCLPEAATTPGTPPPGLPSPSGTEVTVLVTPVLPLGTSIPDSLVLLAGVHEAAMAGRVGAANLSASAVQLLALTNVAGDPVVARVLVGTRGLGVTPTATLDSRSTAEALVFLSPLLASSTPDSATAVLSAIRSTSSFPALVAQLEQRLRSTGVSGSRDLADEEVGARVDAVIREVVQQRGLSRTIDPPLAAATLTLDGPSELNGVRVALPTNDSILITNRRGRWLGIVLRSSNDGVSFPQATPIWPIEASLVGSASLLNIVGLGAPNRAFATPSGSVIRVKAFGMGGSGWSAALADEDRGALIAPTIMTSIYDFMIPVAEVIAGIKASPAVISGTSSWQALLVTETARCLAGPGVTGPINNPMLNTTVTELLSGGSLGGVLKAMVFPALHCAFDATADNPVIVAGIFALAPASSLTSALLNSIPWVKIAFTAYGLADIGSTVYAVSTSDVLSVFTIRDSAAVSPGNGAIPGRVIDAVTGLPVSGATVRLGKQGQPFQQTRMSNASGDFSFAALAAGDYVLEATASGYKTNTADNVRLISLQSGDVARAEFALPPVASTQRFASLSGRVVSAAGTPVVGADVTISGGIQTNGVFRATKTNSDGSFAIAGVVLTDATGALIAQFTVQASAIGFDAASRVVALQENRTRTNVDFVLGVAGEQALVYAENFEQESGWTATGFWNRSRLQNITNAAYPTYVSLAPGDNSNGALPSPSQGEWAFWYGSPSTGNFLGQQLSGDSPKSGGRGVSSNSGTLTSPAFAVPSVPGPISLRFDTWFEVESVNPNQNGYDIMNIQVVNTQTQVVTTLGRLNPFVDPTLSNRSAIPFTSGGFNQPPVWRPAEADLTQFKGQSVRLRFLFTTNDPLYNGFRGWIIDRITVVRGSPAIIGDSPPPFILQCDASCQLPRTPVPRTP